MSCRLKMRLSTFLLPLGLTCTSASKLAQTNEPRAALPDQDVEGQDATPARSLSGGVGVVADLISLVTGIIPGLLDIIDEEDRECKFIGQVRAAVLLAYRDVNVVIFHDTSSNYKGLHDPICFDTALPLPLGFGNKDYRICAFDTGTFVRSGDAGCRNWGYGECAKRINDNTVSFCRRDVAATTFITSPTVVTTIITTTSSSKVAKTTIHYTSKTSTPITTKAHPSTSLPVTTSSTIVHTTTVAGEATTPVGEDPTPTITALTTLPTVNSSPGEVDETPRPSITSSTRTAAAASITQPVFALAVGMLAAILVSP